MRMSNGAGVLQATYAYDEFGQEILDGINMLKNALIEMPFTLNRYGYCYNNGMLMNDLNGMWPNPDKWVKDKTKKAAKAVGKFYAKYRDAVNIVGGVAIIAAGAALAPAFGATAAAVAISGTTAAVIGGLSNMTTGGRFSDGFLGGAVNGTICGLFCGWWISICIWYYRWKYI